jgi:hypothetical protein
LIDLGIFSDAIESLGGLGISCALVFEVLAEIVLSSSKKRGKLWQVDLKKKHDKMH